MGTATVVAVDASDYAAVKAAIETLAPATTTINYKYSLGNKVVFVKYEV